MGEVNEVIEINSNIMVIMFNISVNLLSGLKTKTGKLGGRKDMSSLRETHLKEYTKGL